MMYFNKITLLSLVVTTGDVVNGYPYFAGFIPNGDSVPHFGPQGGIWAGVGHQNAGGGGPLNPFGEDFRNEGFTWSKELCEMDSDGDGRSNGLELGDPECTWSQGGVPLLDAQSHPGFADETVGDDHVRDTCEDYVPPEDEIAWDIVFAQQNQLNSERTQYMCQQFEVDAPSTEDVYHIVKEEALVDNTDTMHHMIVYACFGDEVSSDGDRVGQASYPCNGFEMTCRTIIGGWAIGGKPDCQPPNVGSEINFSSQRVVIKLEAHYDNALGQPQVDQSGMRFSLTPTLRPIKADRVVTGMAHFSAEFQIPPLQTEYTLENICPYQATEKLSEPVYVYSWTPHMHYYGRKLVTEHYRCGRKIGEIGRIEDLAHLSQILFNSNQQTYNFKKPIKILPGDTLYTKCEYDTTSATNTVYGGDETSDEMCLHFKSFYPHVGNFLSCFTFNNGFNTDAAQDVAGDALSDGQDLTGLQTLSAIPFTMVGSEEQFTRESLVFGFNEDPKQNIPDCCATNSCEELYIASFGGACGVDEDCEDGLFCNGGLCSNEPPKSDDPTPAPIPGPTPAPIPSPNTDVAPTPTSSASIRSVLMVGMTLLAGVALCM